MKRRRLALFLALTLAFTSVDSVSLVAGAAEEVQIIDESAEQDSAAVELPPETEAVLEAGQDSVEFTQETIASEAITEVSVPEMPTEESSTEMPTEVPMTEMLQEEPITEVQTEALVTESSEEEILAEDVPEELSESETIGAFEDIVDSQSGDGVVIEDIDIVADTAELAVQNTGTPWDGTAMAEPLALGGSINAELNGEVTEKWFSFTPTKTGRYAFHTMSEGNSYLYAALYTETGAHIDWRSGYVSLLHSHELNAETLYYYRISSDGNPMKFTVSIAEAVEVESAAKSSVKNTFVEKLESIVAYAKFSLTFSNGDTQELSFDESNTAYDKYGNEHTCKITDTAGNPINEYELTPGNYQMIFSCEGKGDYHTEPITVTSLNDFACTELSDGLNHVISGSEYGEWLFYKFTPSQTGKYHFTPVNSMVMYDSEGQWIDRFNTELQGGNTYYITLKGSIWSGEAQDFVYEWDMNIFIVPEVKSAKLLSIKTKYVYPFERVDQFDGNFEVTYTNGKTETVSLSNDWNLTDEMGVQYTDTVCDASGTILDASTVTAPGEYTRKITSGSTIVYEGSFTVLSLEQLPEIKEGTETVKVDKDYQNKEYYRFIPQKSGTYRVSCTDGERDIYDAEGNGIYENILTLEGGKAYYIGFYKWNGGTQTEMDVTISYVPVPESAKVLSGKTTFVDGIESVEEHQTVLELTYSDGTTGRIQIYGSGNFDANDVYIRCMVESADKTAYEVYGDIPVGTYDLVFTCEGKEFFRQLIRVVSVTDIVSGPIKEGSNPIESGVADWKAYSFIPEATGLYKFTPHSEIGIYEDGEELSEIYQDMDSYALESGKTYYVLLRGSIKDGWDDVYSWNMNITRAPEVESIELSPSVAGFTLIADGDSIDRILSSDKYSLKITYTDQSIKEISLNRAFEEMTDAVTGEYVSEYTTTPGNYNLHFVFEGKELIVPVELKAIPEFVCGKWELLDPLTVDNSDEFAIYQVTGGTETVSYTLESDTRFWGALYAENGSIVKHMYRGYEQKIELSAGATYYLGLNAAESVKQYTITASSKKGAEITELCAMTSRETYLADFGRLTREDVAAKMTYDDGTSRTVYGDSRAVSYDIKSSSDPDQVYGLYDILPTGSYSVVPRVTSGSAVSMKTVSVPIEAVPLDPSSLEEVFVDTPVELKNPGGDMYRFVPKEDGRYEAVGVDPVVRAHSYNADTKRWVKMPYLWQMKAGETYVITADDPFMIQKYSEPAPNPGEDETSKGGPLTLDKMEHVVIAKSGDTVKYTFTPEKSGKYLIESSPAENAEEDTVVTLYRGNNRIDEDDDGGSDSNFRLLHYLEAGIEYTYEVGLYSGTGKFNICLTSVAAKSIKKIEIDEIGEKEDGTLNLYDCYMLVTYTDGTTNRLWIGTSQDDYGNEFTYMSKLLHAEEKQRTYRIGVRYRVKGAAEWTTVERDVTLLTIEGRVLGDAVPGTAVVRDVFDSEDEGRDYYRLRVTESGDYNTVTTSDGSIDVYGDSIVDEEMTYVTHLEAGKTYYLCVKWEKYGEDSGVPDSYSVTVHRNKEVAGIEIVGEPKAGYRRLSQPDSAFYRSIKIKVNFQDGSSEYVYGNKPTLSDGNVVSITCKEINDTKMRLAVELSGHRATKIVSLKDPAQAPLMQESGNGYTYSFKNTVYGDMCVMRVVPKQTGTHTIKLAIGGAAEGAYAHGNVYNSNLFGLYYIGSGSFESIELEAGKEYYIAAAPYHNSDTDGSTDFYVSLLPSGSGHTCEWVESTILKKPTCGADGLQKYVCRICGGEKTVVLPATGAHTLVNKVDRPATCGVTGSQHKECTVCAYAEAATVIPATGAHRLINKVDKAATCGTAGSQHRQCTVCGYSETATVIPATGKHSYGAYSDTKAPTALAEGVKTRKCTVCKKTETKTVEKLTPTISLNTKNLVLKTKQSTKAFVVSGMAEGDYVKSIVSSKSSVVKVSGVKADGTCKLKAGKKKGSAVLTITLASGLTKDVKVKVQTNAVKTESIKNVDKKLVVKVKKTVKLTPVLNPITSTDKITYSSSNKKVATVSSKGVIKGIKKGKATITIKAGKKKFVCKVTVKK